MYTKTQLELISLLLDGGEITDEERKALAKTTESALWQVSNKLSAKELKAVEAAEFKGKVRMVEKNVSGIAPDLSKNLTGGAIFAYVASNEKPSRMKPQPVLAKTGEELLAFLGVRT